MRQGTAFFAPFVLRPSSTDLPPRGRAVYHLLTVNGGDGGGRVAPCVGGLSILKREKYKNKERARVEMRRVVLWASGVGFSLWFVGLRLGGKLVAPAFAFAPLLSFCCALCAHADWWVVYPECSIDQATVASSSASLSFFFDLLLLRGRRFVGLRLLARSRWRVLSDCFESRGGSLLLPAATGDGAPVALREIVLPERRRRRR